MNGKSFLNKFSSIVTIKHYEFDSDTICKKTYLLQITYQENSIVHT